MEISTFAGIVSGGNIELIENVGTGWAHRMTISEHFGPVNLRAADLDLDGRVDLVWESGNNCRGARRNQAQLGVRHVRGDIRRGSQRVALGR